MPTSLSPSSQPQLSEPIAVDPSNRESNQSEKNRMENQNALKRWKTHKPPEEEA
jgi:hypothetical protein